MVIPSYYGLLPAAVRYNKKLKPIEKLVYCELTALIGTGRYCIAELEYLCSFTSCTEPTVLSYLSNLEKCGYITSEPLESRDEVKRLKVTLKGGVM